MAKKSAAKVPAIKKVSRNKKRYWRKGVDISDLDIFSENARENERLGISTKSDADLFFIHKDPEDASGASKLRSKVELKCFSNLKPDSAVKPFAEQYMGSKITKRKEAIRLKKLSRKKACKPQNIEKNYDLWEESTGQKIPYLSPDVELGYLRATRKILPKVPNSMKKPISSLHSIEKPHPGQSYNPTFQDHQDLLKRAAQAEAKKLDAAQRLDAKLTPKGRIATEASRFVEDCQGLEMFNQKASDILDSDGELVDDEEDVKPDIANLKPLLMPIDRENRKTSKTRRKEMKEKLLKEKRISEKSNKIRQNDVFRLKSLNKEVRNKLKAIDTKISNGKQAEIDKLLKPAKLGKNKYEEPDLELNLSSEIRGSLRLLKPEGNLLEDRYHSLLKRNVVEKTRLQLSRKRKFAKKKYEKRGCDAVTMDYIPR